MVYSYILLFVASFVLLVILSSKFDKKISIHYYLMFVAILMSNFGYMQLSTAKDLQSALYANQAIYLGASFSPFFFLRCMVDLCKLKMKKWIQITYMLFGGFVFTLISTVGVVDLYYKNVSLGNFHGITYLVKEYGPLHKLYFIYLAVVLLSGIYYVTKALILKRDVAYRNGYALLGLLCVVLTTYIIEKIIPYPIAILPIGYFVSQIGVIILLSRISLYDVVSLSVDSMNQSNDYGFFVYDSNALFLGCDIACKEWFPEVLNLKIDRSINLVKSELIDTINSWSNNKNDKDIILIKKNDLIIEAKHTIIKSDKKNIIHCLYLRDDTEDQEYKRIIEDFNKELEIKVEEKTGQIQEMQNDIIISMASIVENRDNNTGGHIKRTSDVVKIFVEYLESDSTYTDILNTHFCKSVIKAAPLHDFGKIAIPDQILNKPGKFTAEEYEEMKKHPAKGAVIVERILQNSSDELFKKIAVNVAHYHHEKYDGTGYPTNLKGNNIPFEARIMALADVFDALVSKRVYKDKFSYEDAFRIIEESSGSHFDPELCKKFLEIKEKLIELYDSYSD